MRAATRLARSAWLAVVADLALVLVILAGGGPQELASVPPRPAAETTSSTPAGNLALSLSVTPTSWWMLAGNSTALFATWTGVPAGCVGTPLWYRWLVRAGFADGVLAPSDNSSANFTASAEESGTAQIEVRSGITVSCAGRQWTRTGNASSNISVVAPLLLENLSLSPNPLPAGGVANLSVRIAHGEAPYRLRVDWGDGNVSFSNVSSAGTATVPHRYFNGSFVASVAVTDAAGLVADATATEPLSVSSGLAIAVVAPTGVAEVGVPVDFSGVVLHPPASYGYATLCSDDPGSSGVVTTPEVAETNFTCTFAAPGVAEVEFEVVPSGYEYSTQTVTLNEPVAAPLAVDLEPSGSGGEVGRPTVVWAELRGGVAPFAISWQVVGNASVETATSYEDGTVALPVWPSSPGTYSVSVAVTDAVGALVSDESPPLPVDPALAVSASIAASLTPEGALAAVEGGVTGGSAPFAWWVVPAVEPVNETPANGSLGSVGSWSWNATFAVEGNSTVSILVVDREGSEWSQNLALRLVPDLRVTARLNGSAVGTQRFVTLDLVLAGGLPPFETELTLGSGTAWNRTAASDGSYSFVFPTNDSGEETARLSVRDSIGGSWNATTVVEVPSLNASTPFPPPSPEPSPSAPSHPPPTSVGLDVLGGLVVVALAGGLFLWKHRRKTPPPPLSPPDPVEVLRRIVEPAEGAERSSVELLAEEAGVPLSLVRTTIDRLVAEGVLHAETDEDGEEVLAWSGHP